jgi:hypothetical protein
MTCLESNDPAPCGCRPVTVKAEPRLRELKRIHPHGGRISPLKLGLYPLIQFTWTSYAHSVTLSDALQDNNQKEALADYSSKWILHAN